MSPSPPRAVPRRAAALLALAAALGAPLGGCTVEATGIATDFRTVHSGTVRASTAEALVGPDGACEADASADPALLRPRAAGVAIGMGECALVSVLGRAEDVAVDGVGGRRIARLTYDDANAPGGAATYVFTDNRLTRIER